MTGGCGIPMDALETEVWRLEMQELWGRLAAMLRLNFLSKVHDLELLFL